MTDDGDGALLVALPEGFDRKSRLGPFPSGTAALKFLLIGAVGAVLALRFGVLLWTPFLAGGFLLSVHRSEERSLDERLVGYARWQFRRRRRRGSSSPSMGAAPNRPGHGEPPDRAIGLEAGGIPVAFLPPSDAARIFDAYRTLLRRLEGSLLLRVTSIPLTAQPFRPVPGPRGTPEEQAARTGYLELIELLARRRRRRVVRIRLLPPVGAPAGGAAADELKVLSDALLALDIPFRLLSAAELARGWRAPPGPWGPRP
ncbi:MAG: hypothetical protein ACYDFT_07235 [Thermoplasmata archaeon]